MIPLIFANEQFLANADGALFWPRRRALLFADLHFEKASFFARFGQFLPPHDTMDTLLRIERLMEQTEAQELWCLGDNFHDIAGHNRLSTAARGKLDSLTNSIDWNWITGNHDPSSELSVGGQVRSEAHVDGFHLIHQTSATSGEVEISGHWHPKLSVKVRNHRISRRCFVRTQRQLIMPAFGAFTGGLDVHDTALRSVLQGQAEAVLPTADKVLTFPI
jgi:DNA ligase-associated metallophosphoesterase